MRRYSEMPFSIINFVSDLIQLLLGIRFLFALFHANAANRVVVFFRGLTLPLVSPFTGIFPTGSFAGLTVEWSTVVAMFFYAIAAVLLARLLFLFADVAADSVPPVQHSDV